ncbi:MAG: carboxypeptidase M32 [Bacteroidota bacterium]
MSTETQYEAYRQILRKHADVEHAIAVLSWDKEVNAPPRSSGLRAQQLATLSGMAHELITGAELGELLEQLSAQPEALEAKAQRNITLSLKEYRRNLKLPQDFVIRRSKANSAAYDAWLKAREANDYGVYREPLQAVVEIKREEAELLGYEDHPYDSLMEAFEPGARVKALDVLFADVKAQLVDFARALRERPQVDDSFLFQHYDKDKQWNWGLELLRNMGYDFEAGRQDLSPHPFTTSFGGTDVRVTTRIDENNLANMAWSCIHEGGHALYEQGLLLSEYGLPSGRYVSLGIHESQSRLWENNVGRSLAYWKAHYPALQQRFPQQLTSIGLEKFYKGINRVAPSPIRTEADELHYHFHILIRYEIEKLLIEGQINCEGLDEVWNQKYKDYLGLDIKEDREGILQDIHWSLGSIGYFPTYSLGSFYAAQFYQQASKDLPGLEQQIEQGDSSALLKWLREHIHQYGQQYSADELCERICGERLNFQYFMDYARKKYGDIYGL